jgi:hypothetical protein
MYAGRIYAWAESAHAGTKISGVDSIVVSDTITLTSVNVLGEIRFWNFLGMVLSKSNRELLVKRKSKADSQECSKNTELIQTP